MVDKINGGKPLDFDTEGLSDEEINLLSEQDEALEEEFESYPQEGEEGEKRNISGASDDDSSTNEEKKSEEEGDESSAEGQKNDEGNKPPSGFVPIAALHQARLREREATAKLQAMQEQVNTILAKVNGQKQEEQNEEEPDLNDPVGAIEFLMGQEKARREQQQQLQAQQQQEQQLNQFRMDVAREFDEQAAEDKDAAEAFEFLTYHARYEYDNLYSNTGIPFEKYQQDLITNHAIFARQNGIPMAEYVKKFAATRGYTPGIVAQMKARARGGVQQPNGAASQAAQQIEKARQQAELADRNKKIRGGSSGGRGEITLEDLAKMSGPQIERLMETNPDLFKQLTGVE